MKKSLSIPIWAAVLYLILAAALIAVSLLAWFPGKTIFASGSSEGITVYVSSGGSDKNSGLSRSEALASPAGAQKAVRKLIATYRNKGIEVVFAPGTYNLDNTLQFTADDDGITGVPVVWRAEKAGTVTFSGGISLTGGASAKGQALYNRLPKKTRDAVLYYNLSDFGINNPGTLLHGGYFGGSDKPSHTELFYNGKGADISCWPQKDFAGLSSAGDTKVLPDGTKCDVTTYYPDDTVASWKNFDNMVLQGYFKYNWADSYRKIYKVTGDSSEYVMTIDTDAYGTDMSAARFRFVNVADTLTIPGNYVIDFKNDGLYYLPPKDFDKNDLTLSRLETPVLSLSGTAYVTFSGISFAYSRFNDISVDNCKDIVFENCGVSCAGVAGINISGGSGILLSGCDIYQTGEGAISISGGSRESIIPCNDVVTGCSLHDFARWSRTNRVGVNATGCGITISNNEIYNAPHAGIMYFGNDILIEKNNIHNVAQETDDVGAIYTGRNWTFQGNVIRYNHIYDVGPKEVLGMNACVGIYLDDLVPCQDVYGNTIERCGMGMLIGGGKNHVIEDNTITDCATGISLDARAMGWGADLVSNPINLVNPLHAMNNAQPPYSLRYPFVIDADTNKPYSTTGNIIRNNILTGCTNPLQIEYGLDSTNTIKNNTIKEKAAG